MIVSDIIDDIGQILAYCDTDKLYNRLTYAIEVLANKGNWDPLVSYMDIVVSQGNVLTLPRDVEVPIRININNHPSLARDRLYEFTMSGPGTDMADAGNYSWMDKGPVPVLVQPSVPSNIIIFSSNTADAGGTYVVEGRDTNNQPVSDTIVLTTLEGNSTNSANIYAKIERVALPPHIGTLTIKTNVASHQVLSTYSSDESEPQYRQILLTKAAAAVRVLFRRKVLKITGPNDFIPLHSSMAILLMVKALEKMRNEDFDTAQKLSDQAVTFLKDEQASIMAFDLNKDTQTPMPLNLNYNNSDSVIVADIYDAMAGMAGPIGRENTFDFITDTIEALANKGIWDGLDGYVDIVTQNQQYVTLPRYVDTILGINIGGRPSIIRNRWFEFHLNGSGTRCQGSTHYVDDRGEVPTLLEVTFSQQLVAIPDLPADNDTPVRVFGTYQGKELWFPDGINGAMQLGIPVSCNSSVLLPANNAPLIDIITSVTKGSSQGFIRLMGYSPDRNKSNLLGYYYPDETAPMYRRIKLARGCEWIRLRYRKRSRKVSSLTDPLHLRNKQAIITMGRSLMAVAKGDVQGGQLLEDKAVDYLNDEQYSNNPTDTFTFSYDRRVHMADPLQGII